MAARRDARPSRSVLIKCFLINAEYVKKAQRLDQTVLGCVAEEVGPVETNLRSFGTVTSLVFGHEGPFDLAGC